MNLTGSIDLLRLKQSCVRTIKGVRVLIIPVERNDIYVSADQQTGEARAAYLGLNISERQEMSQYGKTHYAKQSFSKQFRENNAQEYEELKKVYLGDFKPNEYHAPMAEAPAIEIEDSDLPF